MDPAALLDEVARVIQAEAPANGVRVEVDAPPATPDVNGDAGMLRQAILNLALNACQAMPNGGVAALRRAARRAKGRVELSVEDTGTGIQPDHLRRIFDLVLHDAAEGHRHRALDGVPYRCSCTTATSRSSPRRAWARRSAC